MYELEKINYAFDALEPVIDEETVTIHHTKHHQNYLNKLNDILSKNNISTSIPLEELVLEVDSIKEEDKVAFLFNIGGVINHDLYFKIMSPKKNTEVKGSLKDAIDVSFGSFESFKDEFTKKASTLMGSGWVFLVVNEMKGLEIVSTSNQESPISLGYKPIMTIDVWEHAYYLKYKNLRPNYVENFFQVVDFDVVNELYEEAIN